MSTSIGRTFVTLADISDGYEPLNYVIYNPSKLRFDTGAKIFIRQMKERYEIDIPIYEVADLMTYDIYHLDEFIERCKEVITHYKHS